MIKATDFISDEAKKEAEQVAIAQLTGTFSEEIAKSILGNMEKFKGWDSEQVVENLKHNLLERYQTGDMIGVATYSMLLWNLQQK